jgi:hypothetical protein
MQASLSTKFKVKAHRSKVPATDSQDTLYLLTILDPDFRYHVIEVYVTSLFAKMHYWDCPDSLLSCTLKDVSAC